MPPPVSFRLLTLNKLTHLETTVARNALLLASDWPNDEQRSDDLSNPSSHRTTCSKTWWWESTNLSASGDEYKNVRNGDSGTKPSNKQRAHRVKDRRLDEHGDGHRPYAIHRSQLSPGRRECSSTLNESEIKKYESGAGDVDHFRAPVDEHNAHHYIGNVSPECRHQHMG